MKGLWECALERNCGASVSWSVSASVTLTRSPKQWGLLILDQTLQNHELNKLFLLLRQLLQVFCYSSVKLTHTFSFVA